MVFCSSRDTSGGAAAIELVTVEDGDGALIITRAHKAVLRVHTQKQDNVSCTSVCITTDAQGAISRQAFIDAQRATDPSRDDAFWEAVFDRLDADKDDSLSVADLEHAGIQDRVRVVPNRPPDPLCSSSAGVF